MKNSLPPFYVGQKVVCVKPNISAGLIKDKIYPITNVAPCSCGLTFVSFGVDSGLNTQRLVCDCGSPLNSNNTQWHVYSTRFAPIQEQNFPLMTFSKIVEKEKEEILINN